MHHRGTPRAVNDSCTCGALWVWDGGADALYYRGETQKVMAEEGVSLPGVPDCVGLLESLDLDHNLILWGRFEDDDQSCVDLAGNALGFGWGSGY